MPQPDINGHRIPSLGADLGYFGAHKTTRPCSRDRLPKHSIKLLLVKQLHQESK